MGETETQKVQASFEAATGAGFVMPVLWGPETSWPTTMQRLKRRSYGSGHHPEDPGLFIPKCSIMRNRNGKGPFAFTNAWILAKGSGANHSVAFGSKRILQNHWSDAQRLTLKV
jgi:hypothetical protein